MGLWGILGGMKGLQNIDTNIVRNQGYHKFYEVYSGQSTTTEAVPVNIIDRVKGSQRELGLGHVCTKSRPVCSGLYLHF